MTFQKLLFRAIAFPLLRHVFPFKAISTTEVKYDVVNSYADLMNLVK